jgi:hypothetical protein
MNNDTCYYGPTITEPLEGALKLLIGNHGEFGSPRILFFRNDPNPEDIVVNANLDCSFKIRVGGRVKRWFTLVATKSSEAREAFVQVCKKAGTFILAIVTDGSETPEALAGKIANLLKHALRHAKRLNQRRMAVRNNHH